MSGIYHKNKEWANVTEINKTGATATDTLKKVTVNGTTYGVESVYAKISSLAAHATVPLDNTTLKIGSDGSDSAVYSTCTKSTYYPSTSTLSLATKTDFNLTQLQDVFIPQIDIDEKTDTAPYIYRPSVANGDRVSEDIVGASVGWNQLVPNSGSSLSVTVQNGHKYVMKKSGTWTVGASTGTAITGLTGGSDMITDLSILWGTSIADSVYNMGNTNGVTFFRKYFPNAYYPYNAGELLSVEVSGKKYVGKNLFYSATKRTAQNLSGVGITAWVDDEGIIRGSGTTTGSYGKYLFLASSDGGAWNTGESGLFIKGATSLSNVSYVVAYSTTPDGSKTYQSIGTSGYYVPANCYIQQIYLQQTSSNKAVTFEVAPQVEFGNTATTYEPYKERTYTFPSQTLRGLFTLVNDELKASGDVYREDGVITRKYGVVDLGTLQWTYSSQRYTAVALGGLIKTVPDNVAPPMLTVDYRTIAYSDGLSNNHDAIAFSANGANSKLITYAESSSTPTPTGLLVYELATPYTEQDEPLVMPQICYKDGTEENLTDSIVPVGHESTYYNYPDYMETGEYKDFRDRVDYAPEKAKWHQVGIYANGDTIAIDGYYNEIMLVPNHYSGTTLLACASPAIFPFSLFKSITLQNSTESERIDITPAGVVGVTGTYFSNVSIFVR